ncbi:DNA polymerase III subunit delta [Candidatus Parcubacteria bacterium]|nr:DNA polymerase III subunit delta [Candidatus Parcubacteria bacterium]
MIFIFGPDTFRSREKLKELVAEYTSHDFELQKIDAEKIKAGELISKFNAVSLLSFKRLLVIENLSQNSEQKEVADFLKARLEKQEGSKQELGANNSNDILIFYEEKVDKKTSLYKFLFKNADKFEFRELNNFELKKWAQEYVKKHNGKIELMALEELLINAKPNLWQLSSELDKLLAFNKNITVENVYQLTSANFDDNIFNLTDAIGNNDKATGLELINKQLESGVEPLYLLSMIIRQFRILLQIKDVIQNQGYSSYVLIAKEIGVHPFVAQKSISQAQKYSFEELENKLRDLQNIDLQLKSSKISAQVLFTRFVTA